MEQLTADTVSPLRLFWQLQFVTPPPATGSFGHYLYLQVVYDGVVLHFGCSSSLQPLYTASEIEVPQPPVLTHKIQIPATQPTSLPVWQK